VVVQDHSRNNLAYAISKKSQVGNAHVVIIKKLEIAVSSIHEATICVVGIQVDWRGEFQNTSLKRKLNQ